MDKDVFCLEFDFYDLDFSSSLPVTSKESFVYYWDSDKVYYVNLNED